MPIVAPRQYVVRNPSGDPDAARRLATAYDELAAAVRDEARRIVAALTRLESQWRGLAARASDGPEQVLTADATRVSRALDGTADDLRHYAHRLAKAHEHHGWSIGKLVALGATVAVGVAAIVVTVGAAAPAEAAAAAAAVEGAEAAATAAGAASEGAAGALGTWRAALSGVRPLMPFLVPHLVSAASATGLEAVSEAITRHRLDPHSLEVAAAIGFTGSSAGTAVEQQLAARAAVLRRLAEAGTWAATGSAGAYADKGGVDPLDSVAIGLTGFVGRDIRLGVDTARLMWKLRVPELPLGFESSREWRHFVTTLYEGVDRAGYRDAVVAMRGSSITGFNYREGHPFDSLYRSDWDLSLAHERALARAVDAGVATAGGKSRTAPLNDPWQVHAVGLEDVTAELEALGGRPVRWMIYRDVASVIGRDQPVLRIPRP